MTFYNRTQENDYVDRLRERNAQLETYTYVTRIRGQEVRVTRYPYLGPGTRWSTLDLEIERGAPLTDYRPAAGCFLPN